MEPAVKSKTAIVTGAAGSLGSALSGQLVRSGWNVVLLDNNRKGLEEVYDQLAGGEGGEAVLHPFDLAGANPELIENLLAAVESELGGLDALVHCAARFQNLAPSETIPPDEWLEGMQVNLNAPWLLSGMALPLLRQSESGKIVFLLEDLEKVGGSLWGYYGVAKHALRALVGQLATECRSSGVAVKGIDPGPMRSPIRTRVYYSENPADMPSAETAALRISAYLSGEEAWEKDFISLWKAEAG